MLVIVLDYPIIRPKKGEEVGVESIESEGLVTRGKVSTLYCSKGGVPETRRTRETDIIRGERRVRGPESSLQWGSLFRSH